MRFQLVIGSLVACLFGAACVSDTGSAEGPVRAESGESFSRVVMDRRDLRTRSFAGARLHRSSFVAANISGGSFRQAFLANSDLRSVRAVGTDFRNARLGKCALQGAELMAADFRGADLVAANLAHADLRGASLAGAMLGRTVFKGAHLAGTKFIQSKGLDPIVLEDAACWDEKTQWPEGWTVAETTRVCPSHAK